MKSQRRHELQQNELADWLGKKIAAIRPYQNLFLGVVVLLAIGGMVYAWWSRQVSSRMVQASDQLYAAMGQGNPMALMEIASKNPNSNVAQFANVVAGDLWLDSGCNTLFSNKATAQQQLRQAVELYKAVIKQDPNSTVAERAEFGLGRAREALGELSDAKKDYETVVKNWPNGTFTAAAASRLKDIDRPAIKDLYDKFAKFDPKPAYSAEPGTPGTPGKRPEFNVDNLPEEGPVFESPQLKVKSGESEPPAAATPSSPSKAESSEPIKPAEPTQPAGGSTP